MNHISRQRRDRGHGEAKDECYELGGRFTGHALDRNTASQGKLQREEDNYLRWVLAEGQDDMIWEIVRVLCLRGRGGRLGALLAKRIGGNFALGSPLPPANAAKTICDWPISGMRDRPR